MAEPQRWNDSSGEVVAVFVREADAADAVAELRRQGIHRIGMRIHDDNDPVANLSGEVGEGTELVATPGPLLPGVTRLQIAGSTTGGTAGAVAFGIVGGVVALVLAGLGAIGWPAALAITLIAAFAGGVSGMVAGGKIGGEYQIGRDETGHERSFIVRIAADEARIDRARQILRNTGGRILER